MKDIDPSADFRTGESLARDVNNRGQVVGEFLTPDQSAFHGFIYDDGLFTDIGVNGSPETVPFGINDQGRVVGITFVPYQALCPDPITYEYIIPCTQYKQRAFFFEDSKFADLNSLIPPGSSWELTWAFDINNRGQIVGYGLVQDKLRAFLLTPATIEQCKNGGWQKHGFKNQGQCIQFVNTGK